MFLLCEEQRTRYEKEALHLKNLYKQDIIEILFKLIKNGYIDFSVIVNLLGERLPKLWWTDKQDLPKQVKLFMQTIGFKCSLRKGKIYLKNMYLYKQEVQKYINKYPNSTLVKVVHYLDKNNTNVISCVKLKFIMDVNFPKAPYYTGNDFDITMVLFLINAGLRCSYNKKKIYFG